MLRHPITLVRLRSARSVVRSARKSLLVISQSSANAALSVARLINASRVVRMSEDEIKISRIEYEELLITDRKHVGCLKALYDIVKHQEMVGGKSSRFSTVVAIASKAIRKHG